MRKHQTLVFSGHGQKYCCGWRTESKTWFVQCTACTLLASTLLDLCNVQHAFCWLVHFLICAVYNMHSEPASKQTKICSSRLAPSLPYLNGHMREVKGRSRGGFEAIINMQFPPLHNNNFGVFWGPLKVFWKGSWLPLGSNWIHRDPGFLRDPIGNSLSGAFKGLLRPYLRLF